MATVLEGTVALVTGASSGIGEATARLLAVRGAAVTLVARRGDRLAALAAQITAAGGTARAIEADLTSRDQAREAVDRTAQALGRLDILINNAGAARRGPFADASPADWEHMVQINVLGSLYCAHAALPHLLEAAEHEPRHVADLVNVSSMSARSGRTDSGVYNATKRALNAYSEALRQEVAGRRVRVSVLEPSSVATELFSSDVRRGPVQGLGAHERLTSADVADTIAYIVTRPRHVAVSELLVRPTEQER